MRAGITGVLLAIVLASVAFLPVLADDTDTITITMTGADELSITLDKSSWGPEDVEGTGLVSSNTEYLTDPPIEWCTLTVSGNCNVNTFIIGEDANWVDNPGAYKWTLSNDGTNGNHIYGLWFRISNDTERGYVPVNKAESEFWPPFGGSSLAPGDTKQFGLKLLTPTSFFGGRQMQTQISVSAVAA